MGTASSREKSWDHVSDICRINLSFWRGEIFPLTGINLEVRHIEDEKKIGELGATLLPATRELEEGGSIIGCCDEHSQELCDLAHVVYDESGELKKKYRGKPDMHDVLHLSVDVDADKKKLFDEESIFADLVCGLIWVKEQLHKSLSVATIRYPGKTVPGSLAKAGFKRADDEFLYLSIKG